MKKKLDIVMIRWVDAHSSDPWTDLEEAKVNWSKRNYVITIGAMVDKTKDHYVVGQNFGEHDIAGWISIPKKWACSLKKMGQVDVEVVNK